MKHTKNNLITIIILAVVMASLMIGTIAVTAFRNVTDKNNHEIMLHYCKENVELMNKKFSEVENTVNTLSDYYLEELNSPGQLENKLFLDDYTEKTSRIAYSIMQNNQSVVSVYLRFNQEITGPLSGYFISRDAKSSTPDFKDLTDLSQYGPSDIKEAGWYYIPVEKECAVWLDPYDNPNNGIYMISYVRPLYIDGTLIGVLGIDLDYDVICNEVSGISLYKSGYAILMDVSGNILYSGNHNPIIPADTVSIIISEEEDYEYTSFIEKQQHYITVSHKMDNGEYLVLLVPEEEIYGTRNQMVFTIILIAIAVSTVVILVLNGMINRIMNSALTDKLTGAFNRNAYLEKTDSIENSIRSGNRIHFAMLVFDINGLKNINDTAGHAKGDLLIINAYQSIKNKFPGYDIYRIGGDEFVVFIEKRTAAIAEKLISEFRDEMKRKVHDYKEPSDEAIVSCGYALYNPETDASCEDTFNRADKNMYEDKSEFYENNPRMRRNG